MDRPVFISYSSTDKAVAGAICGALEKAGHLCWIAPRDIEPGADYPAAILDGLRQARTVVVVVSPAALASPHILSEIGHAFGEKIPIIPFRLAAAPLPPDFDYFLSMSQWLDAHDGPTDANLARLVEAVSQAQAGHHPPTEKTTGRRKRFLIAAAILLPVVVGTVVFWPRPAPPPPVEKKIVTPPADTRPQPRVNPKDGQKYVWIPPGAFTMGCSPEDTACKPDESPAHPVEIAAGFWLGQTEVTNAAYGRSVAASEANLPVVNLTWSEAKAYCGKVGGRLPTEAEWEYAARAGTAGPYYGSPSKIAWYGANSGGDRHPVAQLEPNAYGLYDMLGNASEWVLDRYYNHYDTAAPATGNVEEPLAGNATALARGGFWESEAANIRVSRRVPMDAVEPGPMAGLRCAVNKLE